MRDGTPKMLDFLGLTSQEPHDKTRKLSGPWVPWNSLL